VLDNPSVSNHHFNEAPQAIVARFARKFSMKASGLDDPARPSWLAMLPGDGERT